MKISLFALMLTLASGPLLCERGSRSASDVLSGYTAYRVNALKQHFPNVALLTQDRKTVHFYDDLIKGRIVMIQFMYASCDELCPRTTPNLVKVQKELRKRAVSQVSIVSITVDPVHDTPQVLKAYADGLGVRPGWKFLTGRKADIDLIRRSLGVYDPDTDRIAHMNVLTLGNENTGQWLAMQALAKPGDIVDTLLRLIPEKTQVRQNHPAPSHH
jgi:protein SCO1/2